MPPLTPTNSFMFQLLASALTVVGLTFTITRPVFDKLDLLQTSVTRMEATSTASDLNQASIERRVVRIETDLYRLQEKVRE